MALICWSLLVIWFGKWHVAWDSRPGHHTARYIVQRGSGSTSRTTRPGRESQATLWLGDPVLNHFATDIRKPKIASLKTMSQAQMVQAELMQNCRMEVVDVHRVLRNVESEFV